MFSQDNKQSPPPSSVAPVIHGILSTLHDLRRVEFPHVQLW